MRYICSLLLLTLSLLAAAAPLAAGFTNERETCAGECRKHSEEQTPCGSGRSENSALPCVGLCACCWSSLPAGTLSLPAVEFASSSTLARSTNEAPLFRPRGLVYHPPC